MRKGKSRRGKQAPDPGTTAGSGPGAPSGGAGVGLHAAGVGAAAAVPAAGASTSTVGAARQFAAGDPVFVLHRQSVARPTPAHFKRHLWARWCTRLTEEGACTFRGCTFVHSLTEFREWAADSNAPAHTPNKWREQQCKLSFRAAVDAAEALETGAPLPNEVAGGIEFNSATPKVVRRDWTQPKADSRWRMRVARRPPGLADPRLAAVLCSSQHVHVDVVPRAGDASRPTALSAERVKRLAWEPLPVNGMLLLSARTTKRELRARLALVFVDGSKDKGPKDRSATCTLWAEIQVRAIQPVCLFNEDADSTSLFNDGKRGLREMGVDSIVSDPWDDPRLAAAVPLAPYRMPSVRVMKRAASLHSNADVRVSEPGLFTPLNAGSYADRFHSLLCLNHASHLAALRVFATTTKLENAHPYQGKWSVNVQAGRSVEGESLYGVCVAVRPVAATGEPSPTLLLGHVTDAHDTELKLEFAMEGQPLLRSGTEVRMWLYPPSLRYRLMHRAIEDARPLLPRLFGDSATPDAWRTTRSQDYLVSQGQQWRNVLETLDGDQRRVVESLLAQSAQAVPTVVMGPFGCGKSHAIIRAILAALFGRRGGPGAVLVATQTNSAADYLARAVVDFGPLVSDEAGSRVMRLYATTRNPGQVDSDLLHASNYSAARRAFVAPTYEDVKDKLVIVTTCVMAGALRSAGFGPATVLDARGKRVAPAVPLPEGADDHFTDIIIDEAAQVWEPEALIPISLAGSRTKITLVGDPQQQQPSVHSWLARRCGLGRSVLERMYELPCYVDDKTTATRCRILLRNNYRCHKEIVQFAAEFYPYNIIPNCTLAAPVWPNTRDRHALVFQPVVHDDPPELLNRGGSITEADATIQVAMELVRAGDVALEDILIIAPHFLQMQVIRSQAKRSRESRRLNVDSITNVQGREFSVLIISTLSKFARNLQNARARSSSGAAGGAGVGAGAGAGAGAASGGGDGDGEISRVTPTPTLLGNRRLFNTVVTRAKRLVVAVGNPADLEGDRDWARFLRLAYKAPAELRGTSPVARTANGRAGRGGGGGGARRNQRSGAANASARAAAPAPVDPPRVDSLPPRRTAPVASPAPTQAPVLPPPQPSPQASGPSSLGGTPLRQVARSPAAAPGSPAPVAPPSSAGRRVGGTPLMNLSPHVGARAAAAPGRSRAAPGPPSPVAPSTTAAPPGLGGGDAAAIDAAATPTMRPWGAAPGGLTGPSTAPPPPQSQDALVDSLATAPLPPVSGGHSENPGGVVRQMPHPARPEDVKSAAAASAMGAPVAAVNAAPGPYGGGGGGGYAAGAGAIPGIKPPFESLQVEDVFLFALRHDQDGAVRGLYTRKQVQAVLRELWQGVDHWQVCRVTPLRLVFSVFVPLRQCVFNGQFLVPMDVPIERALWPHAMPLW